MLESTIPRGDGCIQWLGAKTTLGYPNISLFRKKMYVHRIVCAQKMGLSLQDIRGLVVRHACDNPSCINADHLLLGTQADNMRDKVERGRHKPNAETIARMSAAQKNYFATHEVSPETRAKQRAAQLGRKASEETKKKIALACKGHKHSEASKAKMRDSWVIRKQSKVNA